MKKSLFSLTLFVILFSALKAQEISSYFDVDDEDWIIIGDASSSEPMYFDTGGNPGGHIKADDTANGGVWYFMAPEKFYGDQSESYGKYLRFDLAQSNLDSQFDADDVRIESGKSIIALDLPNNPGIDWTHYDVKLDSTENWMMDTYLSGIPASEELILYVLSNITAIIIRGEYVSGPDIGSLDNVILESTTMAVDDQLKRKLKFYPNPVVDKIYFTEKFSSVEIYNFTGIKMNINIHENYADVAHLPPGIYIIRTKDKNGILSSSKFSKK